nr:MAG TPA: hypothetical protein [Caudoviricetes sp.]
MAGIHMDYPSFLRLPYRSRQRFLKITDQYYEERKKALKQK